jgi:hypothetical protein
MALDPISAGLELANTVVKTIWPDTSQEDAAKIELVKTQIATQAALLIEQAKTNQIEAASSRLFVAGARPALMWLCGFLLFWSYVGAPLLVFFLPGRPLPSLGTEGVFELTMGMLGLAGWRTLDKIKGVASK